MTDPGTPFTAVRPYASVAALTAAAQEPPSNGSLISPSMNYYIPQWEERTSYGFRRMDPYGKLFEDRIIFLGTPISDDVANAVMAQLLCLESIDPDRDIQIYINSPGGSITAIYDTMQFVRCDVSTTCMGQAASAAAVLLAAGAKGKRSALPHSRILIHQPATEGTYGQATDLEIAAREILRMRRQMEEMISRHSNKTVDEVEQDIERDKILTAPDALEYGLIDGIIEPRKANVPSVPVTAVTS